MTDIGSHHPLKGRMHGDKSVVLVPAPSSDPHDPLNWNRKVRGAL